MIHDPAHATAFQIDSKGAEWTGLCLRLPPVAGAHVVTGSYAVADRPTFEGATPLDGSFVPTDTAVSAVPMVPWATVRPPPLP
ncbi:MAG: hypothetical protein P4L86_26085, partial [Mycobacterium sp.]|nr:hypothetical protein [Mycobacterium sp.]